MKKFVLASLMAVTLGSFAAVAEELTGYVSDAHCGAKHNTVSDANTQCIAGCLKKGDPVLVVGEKVYKLDADSATKAKAFAGQSVKVSATVDGDSAKISSIAKAE